MGIKNLHESIETYQMLKENLIIQNKHDEEYTNS